MFTRFEVAVGLIKCHLLWVDLIYFAASLVGLVEIKFSDMIGGIEISQLPCPDLLQCLFFIYSSHAGVNIQAFYNLFTFLQLRFYISWKWGTNKLWYFVVGTTEELFLTVLEWIQSRQTMFLRSVECFLLDQQVLVDWNRLLHSIPVVTAIWMIFPHILPIHMLCCAYENSLSFGCCFYITCVGEVYIFCVDEV